MGDGAEELETACPVYRAFLAITRSMAIAGISPLLIPRYRRRPGRR